MPRVEVTAEHHDFARFVCPRNFRNSVVRSSTFRVDAVDDVEFEHYPMAISHQPPNASVVFITHLHCWNSFVNVESSIVESADLTVFAACVVDAQSGAVPFSKQIQLLIDLTSV